MLVRLASRAGATPASASKACCYPFADAAPCLRPLIFGPGSSQTSRALSSQVNVANPSDTDKGQQAAISVDAGSAEMGPGDRQVNVVTFTNSQQEEILLSYTRHRMVFENLTKHEKVFIFPQTLRDDCTCSMCKDVSSGQKTHSQGQVPSHICFGRIEHDAYGIHIHYQNDIPMPPTAVGEHSQQLTWEDLDRLARPLDNKPQVKYDAPHHSDRFGVEPWDRDELSSMVRTIDFHDYMKGGEATEDVIVDLVRYGLVFLRNVPEDPESVTRIATRIANIQETFYGRTFDVRAKPNAENVAYTSGYLGLHQDLLYLNSPPKIQILHCMENSCPGGESLFCDAHRLGLLMASSTKTDKLFRSLLSTTLHYRYDKNGYTYSQHRKVLTTDKLSTFSDLWWSPPFLGTWPDHSTEHRDYFLAARAVERLIHDESNMYEHKLKPGECVLFDNRRVLHGRRAFDVSSSPGGSRWLRGAYISDEDFKSRVMNVTAGYPEKTGRNVGLRRSQLQERLAGSKKDTAMLYRIMDEVRAESQRNHAALGASSLPGS